MPKGQRAHDAIKIPNHTRDDLGYYVAPVRAHLFLLQPTPLS